MRSYRLTGHIIVWGLGDEDTMIDELKRRFDRSGVTTVMLRRSEDNTRDVKAEYVVICPNLDVYNKFQWELDHCSLHFEVMQREA